MSLKFVSVNIEHSRHLPQQEAFLHSQQPDVVCLQELSETDIPFFQAIIGPHYAYAPMTLYTDEKNHTAPMGVGIFSPHPLYDVVTHMYVRNSEGIPAFTHNVLATGPSERPGSNTLNYPLLTATVEGLRIATTHLRVTEQGTSTPGQRQDAAAMLTFAKQEAARAGGLFLCGDFNAPRGRATFQLIADEFIDAIPAHYPTSVDLSIHRAGKDPIEAARVAQYMVDGLFHTPTYKAENVALNSGVSDHMAITATLSRA